MSIYTFRRMTAPNGMPGWRVLAGSAVLGTLFDAGPGPGSRWRGVAPDGTTLGASSREKLAEALGQHAAEPDRSYTVLWINAKGQERQIVVTAKTYEGAVATSRAIAARKKLGDEWWPLTASENKEGT